MKKLVLSLLFSIFALLCAAQQPNEVTLVVSGDGATKEEATNNALRSAIEQAYGVFVSANTDLVNDDVVKDEIATVTSGNIKSFQEVSYFEGPSGIKSITLKAIVSIGKLIEYSKNHGSKAEFAGAKFGANLRLANLNKENALMAYNHLLKELEMLHPLLYGYVLTPSNPKADGQILFTIKCVSNDNTASIGEQVYNTLYAISLDKAQAEPLLNMGIDLFEYSLMYMSPSAYPRGIQFSKQIKRFFYFKLNKQLNDYLCPHKQIVIKDDLGNIYSINTNIVGTTYYDNFNQGSRVGGTHVKGLAFGVEQGIIDEENYYKGKIHGLTSYDREIIIVSDKIKPNELVYEFENTLTIPVDRLFTISSFAIESPSVLAEDDRNEKRERIIEHTVKYYENIDDIARKYSVTAKEIMELNGLKTRKLSTRQVIKIRIKE